MMGEAPFGSPRLEDPERKHRKGPYNPEIGAPMGVGTNAWPGTTAGNVGQKSNRSREERSSRGWLAVGAVAVEPFSTGQFPANREKYRENLPNVGRCDLHHSISQLRCYYPRVWKALMSER
jgi:hypothetical protein